MQWLSILACVQLGALCCSRRFHETDGALSISLSAMANGPWPLLGHCAADNYVILAGPAKYQSCIMSNV